jgi:hypothetical protein
MTKGTIAAAAAVLATAKHYAGYSETQGGRDFVVMGQTVARRCLENEPIQLCAAAQYPVDQFRGERGIGRRQPGSPMLKGRGDGAAQGGFH